MTQRLDRLRALDGRQWLVVAESVVLVPVVELSLRRRGYKATRAWLERAAGIPSRAGAGTEWARRVGAAVSLVGGSQLVGARCLARSLVTQHLLARRGVASEVVLGVAPRATGNFAAHAWVEVDGIPVNDEPGVRERFPPLAREPR